MGIIGKTQGVKASSRPKPKKLSSVSGILPEESLAAIASCSETLPDSEAESKLGAEVVAGSEDSSAATAGLLTRLLSCSAAKLILFLIGG